MTIGAGTANRIDARAKSVRELLNGVRYTIDFYQREYKWTTDNIAELLADLEDKFLSSYDPEHERFMVEHYPQYFLGSIVISHKDGQSFIIDGQQRLTSLTLLLVYLHNRTKGRDDAANITDVKDLIFSTRFGKKAFNLDVDDRTRCMETLFSGDPFDATDEAEAVRNIDARYKDIQELFPESLRNGTLPFFIDWLLENVRLVEITAYSDDDAYTIFETMNDRGLSLSPTDMLKGYLLANITDPEERVAANDVWKQQMLKLISVGKEEEADFFKAWVRAKYARTIRDRKKDATNKDFEKIGTAYHRWIKDERKHIGLDRSGDFRYFVDNLLARYSDLYIRLLNAARVMTPGLEEVYYNAQNNFTLQYPLMLAPIRPEDDKETVQRKLRLVATYIDILTFRRVVNFRQNAYSTIVYTMFNVMKDIRDFDLFALHGTLKAKLAEMREDFSAMPNFYLHQQNPYQVHHMLARMTAHIERESGMETSFATYVARDIKKPFEIEHIWADRYERHTLEFATREEFLQYRQHVGNLVLLPRGFNQSLNDGPYEQKLPAYFGQNLLARSLNEQCYQNNPSFLAYVRRSGLPFHPHPQFRKVDVDERQALYQAICEEIWSPARLDREVAG